MNNLKSVYKVFMPRASRRSVYLYSAQQQTIPPESKTHPSTTSSTGLERRSKKNYRIDIVVTWANNVMDESIYQFR